MAENELGKWGEISPHLQGPHVTSRITISDRAYTLYKLATTVVNPTTPICSTSPGSFFNSIFEVRKELVDALLHCRVTWFRENANVVRLFLKR